jgi:hypothetical protein
MGCERQEQSFSYWSTAPTHNCSVLSFEMYLIPTCTTIVLDSKTEKLCVVLIEITDV